MEELKKTFDACCAKRVSYILTIKNRSDFLDAALERTKNLLTPDDELLVIDGGSGPDVLAVLEKYRDIIRAVISEPDASPGHALNKGMLLARGKYIRHITDDDITYPEGMEQVIGAMERHAEVDIVVCGGIKQFGKKKTMSYVLPGVHYGSHPEDAFRYGSSGAGFVIRRSALARSGLFPTGAAADNEFIAAAIHKGATVKFCRALLYYHPIYEHSFIVARRKEHKKDLDRIIRWYCSRLFYYFYRMHSVVRVNYISIKFKKLFKKLFPRYAARKRDRKKMMQYEWDGGFS